MKKRGKSRGKEKSVILKRIEKEKQKTSKTIGLYNLLFFLPVYYARILRIFSIYVMNCLNKISTVVTKSNLYEGFYHKLREMQSLKKMFDGTC